jgi:hypothetical protein
MTVMVSTIITTIAATMVSTLVSMIPIISASTAFPASPTAGKNTPGDGKHGDEGR